MMVLRVSNIAVSELKEAVEWYETQGTGLGEKLMLEVERKLNIISQFADRYPVRVKNFRETPLLKFPFVIVYRFNKQKQAITVTSIYHTSRNPTYKYRK